MAQIIADVVRDTTTTTGTGAKTLANVAPLHHQTLAEAAAVTGDTVYLRIAHATLDEWEIGNYTYNSTGPTITRIGEVFGEIKNKIQSGYNLRDVIDLVDELRFRSQTEKHELSHLYEAKIKNMGNAGRNGGEYYTPRPLIRAIVAVTADVNVSCTFRSGASVMTPVNVAASTPPASKAAVWTSWPITAASASAAVSRPTAPTAHLVAMSTLAATKTPTSSRLLVTPAVRASNPRVASSKPLASSWSRPVRAC